MAKPRSSSSKRDREIKKREREQMKRDKATLKRQQRDNNDGAPEPLAPDGVRDTEADAQQPDDQDASLSPRQDSEPESDIDVGRESSPDADSLVPRS